MSWTTELNINYLHCRETGHLWQDGSDVKQRIGKGMVGRELRCENCNTQRIDIFVERTGQLEMRRYIYPDGYQRPAGVNSVPRTEIRKELFKRLVEVPATQRIKFVWEKKPNWRDM